MQTMTHTKLRELRDSFDPKVSQEELARLADIRLTTYRNAESGRKVSFTTASRIHNALNSIRKDRGFPEMGIFELGLNIV